MSSLQNRFHALLWLLETEKAHLLSEEGRIVFYGAEAHPILQTLSAPLPSNTTTRRVTCHQTFLPKSRGIPKELWTPTLPDTEERPTLILIAGTKSKSANILTLRRAAEEVHPRGVVIFTLENDLGAKSLIKRLRSHGLEPEVFSKHRSQLAVLRAEPLIKALERCNTENEAFLSESIDDSISHNGRVYSTHPSLFSWREPDRGSLLLSQHLPDEPGRCADFCCGWGFLGFSLLLRSPGAENCVFIDAEKEALSCVQETARRFQREPQIECAWEDLTEDSSTITKISGACDTIVANLPYHEGKEQSLSLQQRFVPQIQRALSPQGTALLLLHHTVPDVNDTPWRNFRKTEILFHCPPYLGISLAEPE